MMQIKIITKDNYIWNQAEVYAEIVYAMTQGSDMVLDLESEGPSLSDIGLYQFIDVWSNKLNYDVSRITILTKNLLEHHHQIPIKRTPDMRAIHHGKEYETDRPCIKQKNLRHFGLFVGRSNAPRLYFADYLRTHHADKVLLTYHFNLQDDFHRQNIGLEELLTSYAKTDVSSAASLLSHCPLGVEKQNQPFDATEPLSHRLLQQDKESFAAKYQDFFVELVCETYFSGRTFFPTEKTWRAIVMKTPFIVQGPKNFLKHLKQLGFRTFDRWWDEGYHEDPADHQLFEITQVLEYLSKKSSEELYLMYQEMTEVLDHNYTLLKNLSVDDFQKVKAND